MTSATAKTVKVFDGHLIWKGRFFGLKIYWRSNFQTQCLFLLRDERLEFSSRSRYIRSSTGRIQIDNANRFICDNIFRSLSITGANTTGGKRRDPIVALNWRERRYEIYTSKSLGRERSKSWAKSVAPFASRLLELSRARVCILPAPQSQSPKLETTRSLTLAAKVILSVVFMSTI